MKSKKIQLWSIFLFSVFCVISTNSKASPIATIFDDGQTHNIDYDVFDNGGFPDVWVRNSSSGQKTTVNLLSGGSIKSTLSAFGNSEVNISGGDIGMGLGSLDNSQVYVSGGWIGNFAALDNSQVYVSGGWILSLIIYNSSQVEVSGGTIDSDLHSEGNSQANILGGYIGGDIKLSEEGIVTIYGNDFVLNGVAVGTGTFGAGEGGRLTGLLANGDPINNIISFYSDDSRLILIPEPATLFLLGFGAVMLRKKRC